MSEPESDTGKIEKDGYFVEEDELSPSYMKTTVTETTVETTGFQCDGCGNEWMNRATAPKRCPECNAEIAYERSDVSDATLAAADVDTDESEESDDEEPTVKDLIGGGDE